MTSKLRLALFASLSLYFIGSAAPSLAQSLTINSVGPPTQVGSGTGKRAIWVNAGTVGSTTVDIVAEMNTATLNHNFTTTSNRPSITSVGQDDVFITWSLFQAGTYNIATNAGGVPVTADIHIQFNDVDGPNNEQIYVPVCSGTVDWIRIDQSATTGRAFGTVAGQAETFSLIGDQNYNNEPESGLEISYSNRSRFSMGRTANSGFLIRLDNPTYSAFTTFDYQCADFTPPAAVDDTGTGAPGTSASVSILLNDTAATANNNPPNNNSLAPSEFALQSVSLVAPSGATGVTTDGAGDTISFTVPGEGTWSQDDSTGDLTFTPLASFSGSPTPISYTFRNDLGQVSNAATVTITYPGIGIVKGSTFNDEIVADGNGQVGETITFDYEVTNPSPIPLDTVTISETGFTGAGTTPTPGFIGGDTNGNSQLDQGETWTYSVSYTLIAADITAGGVSNQATASGSAGGTPVSDLSDSSNPGDGDGTGTPGPGTNNDDVTTISISSAPIDAVDDTPTGVNGLMGDTIPTVLVNDTLNSVILDLADITLTPGTAPTPTAGSIMMNGDGTISVAAGTTAGSYSYPYQICEVLNPTNCDTATATVVVDPAPIDAIDDTPTSVNGFAGATIPTVLGNDTLDSVVLDPADVALTPSTAPISTAGSITMNPDGTITVAAGTTAGSYSYPYQICEILNPTNCDTATATVVVDPAPIDAVVDTPPSVNGATGATIPTILGNDTLNGTTVDPSDITLTPGTAPTPTAGSITMNADGSITVAPGTTSGSYTYPYQICEILNPTNCDTTTVTVTVGTAPIAAIADTPPSVNGTAGATISTVLANDTLNGAVVDPADITLTPGTAPTPATGAITMNADGTITVAPGTTAGSYTYEYTICELLNPTNCATTNATVVVDAAPIVAVDDTPASINGFDGATTPESVLDNDTLNGIAVVPSEVTLTPGTAPTPIAGSISMNPDGTITVSAGTTAGSYTYEYTICQVLNPSNCSTGEATVVVDAAPIDAIDDSPASINGFDGGTTPESVLDNDTLNGVAVDPAEVTLTPGTAPTPAAGSITMNGDGTVTIAAGTTAGSYSYPYEICETLNPANCDTSTATIVVDAAPIDAVDDTPTSQNGFTGGTTPESVLDNDTLNGVAVVPSEVTLTPGTAPTPAAGSISMNPDGTITVGPGTTAGSYTYEYTICEVLNPANCDMAEATVSVDAAPIDAIDDLPTAVNGFGGGTTPESVLDNDTLNGTVVDPANVTLTPGAAPTPTEGSITMNPDGTITVAAGTSAGTYSYDYTICEVINPANCDSAIATVTVDIAPLDQISEELSSILEEDLATTISSQSRAFSALSGSALDRLMDSRGNRTNQCAAALRNIMEDDDINFATASAVILPESEPVLDEIATALSGCPASRFEIAGHTDSRGGDAYNINLSQARVNSVRSALISRGIVSDRLVGVGYGERRPIADNNTVEGRAANRRVEFVAIDDPDTISAQTQRCGTIDPFDVDGGLEIGENGLNTAGTFGSETFNCSTSERRITRGEFRITDNDDLGTQGMLSFSIARERQVGSKRLNGRFWGGYLSRTSVESTADGDINGVGVNAGIYNARALDNGLYSNFYAAGSVGIHAFDLEFDSSVSADGEYFYAGLFAGAGLSGVIEREAMQIRPRIGFDIGAGYASDADVTASGLGATQTGTVDIDPALGFRGYVETAFITDFGQSSEGDASLSEEVAVTPRLFCDSDFGSSGTDCGLGGRFELSRFDPNTSIDWQLSLDVEATSDQRSVSFGIARERGVLNGLGTVSTQLSGTGLGDAEVSHNLNFRW